MARKEIDQVADELRSWLPNYNHGPGSFPELIWRILASLPGGEEAEGLGYEPLPIGWKEAELLEELLHAIQDKHDVEDLVELLLDEDEDEEDGEDEDEDEED